LKWRFLSLFWQVYCLHFCRKYIYSGLTQQQMDMKQRSIIHPGMPENPELGQHISSVKTHSTIAQEYGVHPRTLRRWCVREGLEIPSTALSPRYQRLIYETFGIPPQ
jgi:hypothetical protein